MASSYPGAVDSFPNNTDAVDTVSAADMNAVQDGVTAVQTELGTNPKQISDTAVAPASTPASVAAFLDMVAYQLKAITGGANWYTAPGATLAAILGLPFITNGTDATLTGETAISSVIGAGALGSRPAAAAGNTGWMYLVTSAGDASAPTGTIARSNGTDWINVGFYPQNTPTQGAIPYFDAASKQWTLIPIGSGSLQSIGTVPYWAPSTVSPGSGMLTGPAVYDKMTGTWTQYASITTAIAAAASGQFVVIPPGTYAESITLKSGVIVCELSPGSVTISGRVTTADSGFLSVDTITSTSIAVFATHTSGTCEIVARQITLTGTGIIYAVEQTGAGTTLLRVGSIYGAGGSGGFDATFGLSVEAGVLTLHADEITVTGHGIGAQTSSTGVLSIVGARISGDYYDLARADTSTLNVYNCQYDTAKTSGALTFLNGDRMRPAQIALMAGSLS